LVLQTPSPHLWPHSPQAGGPQSWGQLQRSSLQAASQAPSPHFWPHSPHAGGPQSWAQEHLVSPLLQALSPQPWQSSGHEAIVSLLSASQAPLPHEDGVIGITPQAPQSLGQDPQVSVLGSQAPSPQRQAQSLGQDPQVSPCSHFPSPHVEQGPQSGAQFAQVSPCSQALLPQHDPQSAGHCLHDSPPCLSHFPSPQAPWQSWAQVAGVSPGEQMLSPHVGQAPQSAWHRLQLSVTGSHFPSPQHDPQSAGQEPQDSPTAQTPSPQLDWQSSGQVVAVSPASQRPFLHCHDDTQVVLPLFRGTSAHCAPSGQWAPMQAQAMTMGGSCPAVPSGKTIRSGSLVSEPLPASTRKIASAVWVAPGFAGSEK
jgi:hypothetical protein